MEFNEKQALQVIEEMIGKTKEEIKSNGFYYMVWGWLVLIAALSNFYLLVYTEFEIHSLPWMILMPLGGVITWIKGRGEKKTPIKVKTYMDDIMQYFIRAFAISMFLVCFLMPIGEQWKAFYPTIMVVYSIFLYLSGGIFKFKPLVYGAYLNWAMAGIGYVWASTSVHLILISIAVLGGYIIPGYLLNRRSNQHVQGA